MLKNYFAFRRLKNFACVEVHPQTRRLLVFVKVNPDDITLTPNFTRDVRNIGHFGTGDLEITIGGQDDPTRSIVDRHELRSQLVEAATSVTGQARQNCLAMAAAS